MSTLATLIVIPQFVNVFYGDADPLNSLSENILSFAYINKNVKLKEALTMFQCAETIPH